MAVRKGLKLSEYGLFDAKTGELLVAETEEEVYERLGLPWIPPTLREDRGEVEAALEGELPDVLAAARTSAATCTRTRTSPTGSRRSSRWSPPRPTLRLRVLRGHRPRAEPVHAADDRREDARPAGAAPGAAVRVPEDDAAARHRAQHRPGRRRRLGRRSSSPGSTSASRRCTRTSTSRSDEMTRADRAGDGEPVRQHHRPPHRPHDRQAAADRRRPRGGVRGGGADRAPRSRSTRYPDRLDLRDEHILWARRHGVKFAVDTDSHATAHLTHMRYGVGDRAARLAHQGRRDQRLAARQAPGVPARRAGREPARRALGRRLPRSFFARPSTVVAPDLLGRILVRVAARRHAAGGAGSSRPRPTSRATRRATRSAAADAAERGDVRARRAAVRVLHLRHALLHERGDRPRRGRERGAAPRRRAARGPRGDGGQPGDGSAPAPVLGPGAPDPGARHRTRRQRRRPREGPGAVPARGFAGRPRAPSPGAHASASTSASNAAGASSTRGARSSRRAGRPSRSVDRTRPRATGSRRS